MRRPTFGRRTIGAAALVLTGAAFALAPTAKAVPLVPGTTITAKAAPSIAIGTNGQAAGDLVLSGIGGVVSGDAVTIEIDDNDEAVNCASAGDTLGFSAIATAQPPDNVVITTTSTAGACADAGVKNRLVITANKTVAANTLLVLRGITYDVGANAALGKVRLKVTGTAAPAESEASVVAEGFSTEASNASISDVAVNLAGPPPLLGISAAAQTVPNVVFTEKRPGALNEVCIGLAPPTGTTFTTTPLPTVTVGSGNAVVGPVSFTEGKLTFDVTTLSTNASTLTLTGLKVSTGTGRGNVLAAIGNGPCAGPAASLGTHKLALVGAVDGRLAGANRYATARLIANETYGDECLNDRDVVIARGDNFPDALAASYLAGKLDSPILLTASTTVPPETLDALAELGAKSVLLIGGNDAITPAVATQLEAVNSVKCDGTPDTTKLIVRRVGGADRYETAKLIAERPGLGVAGTTDKNLDAFGAGACNPVKTAIVASGANFPDALSAGGLAFHGVNAESGCGSGSLPLLLTAPGTLPQATRDALINLGIKQVVLLGGTEAVSNDVAATIAGGGIEVVRIAGATRQGTAIALGNVLGNARIGGFGAGGFLLSRPDNFPDALAAAPLAGSTLGVLYLTESTTVLGTQTTEGIRDFPGTFTSATLLGGPDALSDAVLTAATAALAGQD